MYVCADTWAATPIMQCHVTTEYEFHMIPPNNTKREIKTDKYVIPVNKYTREF